MTTVGVVAPGAMGSALGRVWAAGGARVVATVCGRSDRTRELAHGLELLPDLDAVVEVADLVVSIVPPGQAVAVARDVAAAAVRTGARPLVADLNAIAPTTVDLVAAALGDLELVDGSISGPPPHVPGTTLYVSGPCAHVLLDLPAPGLTLQHVGPDLGTASAVKMCTASYYKGTTALLTQALQTAAVHGVVEIVLADLGIDPTRAARQVASGAAKSDRYPGEMREIASAQGDAGAEPSLFQAMAAVWERVHGSRLAALTPEQAVGQTDLTEVLDRLRRR